MSRYGTSHFVDIASAVRYYKTYGFSRDDVLRKIGQGEIAIGPPETPLGSYLTLDRPEGRYFVEDRRQ